MRLITLLCVALALSGCGVDTQSGPEVFAPDDVPFGLIDTTPTSSAPMTSDPNATTTSAVLAYEVYFIRSGVLVAVTRHAASVPTPADAVKALLAGPTPAETDAGLRSALTGPEIISRTRAAGTTVAVDLARNFNEVPRTDRIFALGQITLTLTAQPGVALVQYTIADTPIEVPKANGIVTRDPVGRADYVSLLQPSTSAPPTTTR
jgi:spore germination protein GerM